MIRVLDGLPDNVLGVEAVGKVTDDDYENVLTPAVNDKLGAHDTIRCIYVLGDEFDGWTLGGMWEDARSSGTSSPPCVQVTRSPRRLRVGTGRDSVRRGPWAVRAARS